ncbi:MAG: hypothetical protein MUE68_01625 [Bacteroidetes bacterium]|nr:hypothetical protein [Bacteroidota bacterium]
MKKLLLVVVAITMVSSMMFGQIAFKNGDTNVSGLIGIGGFAGGYGTSTLPALAASYEVGITENVSVGGIFGYTGTEESFGFGKVEYSYILIGARGAYHYDLLHNEKIDTYGGIMLGYNIVSSSVSSTIPGFGFSASGNYLAFGGFIGGRYYFTPQLAAQAELGYGIGLLTVGVSYKL